MGRTLAHELVSLSASCGTASLPPSKETPLPFTSPCVKGFRHQPFNLCAPCVACQPGPKFLTEQPAAEGSGRTAVLLAALQGAS